MRHACNVRCPVPQFCRCCRCHHRFRRSLTLPFCCCRCCRAPFGIGRAETWEELVTEHDLWMECHNTQRHSAHEGRSVGRRRPSEVLGPVRVVRHHPTDLSRAFFSTMLVRRLDAAGYARVKHWRVYAEGAWPAARVAGSRHSGSRGTLPARVGVPRPCSKRCSLTSKPCSPHCQSAEPSSKSCNLMPHRAA
jgi:hypothetical protein